MKDESYNGWSNYETWLAQVWLTNDSASYEVLREALQVDGETYEKALWLEGELRDQVECVIEVSGLWTDLLTAAFSQINWHEIIASNQEVMEVVA
jgi:hypothetical protein